MSGRQIVYQLQFTSNDNSLMLINRIKKQP
jgi:hypothetical protein